MVPWPSSADLMCLWYPLSTTAVNPGSVIEDSATFVLKYTLRFPSSSFANSLAIASDGIPDETPISSAPMPSNATTSSEERRSAEKRETQATASLEQVLLGWECFRTLLVELVLHILDAILARKKDKHIAGGLVNRTLDRLWHELEHVVVRGL